MALSELGFLLHLEVCLVPLTNTAATEQRPDQLHRKMLFLSTNDLNNKNYQSII